MIASLEPTQTMPQGDSLKKGKKSSFPLKTNCNFKLSASIGIIIDWIFKNLALELSQLRCPKNNHQSLWQKHQMHEQSHLSLSSSFFFHKLYIFVSFIGCMLLPIPSLPLSYKLKTQKAFSLKKMQILTQKKHKQLDTKRAAKFRNWHYYRLPCHMPSEIPCCTGENKGNYF